MNPEHQNLCASPEWAAWLQSEILPAVTAGIDLGKDMLEIGPGPGAATGWLAERVSNLTALESDEGAAARLAERYSGSNVTVHTGDATLMPYPDEAFDTVVSFTMLHHVPTAAAQYQIMDEVLRVLRPGGMLAGSDSLASVGLHHFHADDIYNPLDPAMLLCWLRTLGFSPVTITVGEVLMFTARKPTALEDPSLHRHAARSAHRPDHRPACSRPANRLAAHAKAACRGPAAMIRSAAHNNLSEQHQRLRRPNSQPLRRLRALRSEPCR